MNKKINVFLLAGIVIYLLIIVFPFIWVLLTSLKPEMEIYGKGAFNFFTRPTFENYLSVFKQPIMNSLKNSIIISSITTVYVTGIASMCAYAIARLKFWGKKALLALVLATSMFPQMIVVQPVFNMFNKLHLLNSYFVVLPYSTITLPVSIYILVAHFSKIPRSMEESAYIDGASKFKTFYKIIFPLALPGVFTAAIITFIAAWNEFLLTLTLNPIVQFRTATVEISFLRGQFTVYWGQVMAATVMVTIPTLIIVLLFQKQIISGLTSGAVKE